MFPPPSLRRRGNISTSPPRNTIPTASLKVDPTRPELSGRSQCAAMVGLCGNGLSRSGRQVTTE